MFGVLTAKLLSNDCGKTFSNEAIKVAVDMKFHKDPNNLSFYIEFCK